MGGLYGVFYFNNAVKKRFVAYVKFNLCGHPEFVLANSGNLNYGGTERLPPALPKTD